MSNPEFNLEAFRRLPDPHIVQFYRDYRQAFIRWAKSWSGLTDEDELADIFQRSIITFWENVQSGHLTVLTASPKTYLYGIGRNLVRERTRKPPPDSLPDQMALPDNFMGIDMGIEKQMIQEEENQKLAAALAHLGEPCQTLLRLTYYEGMKSAEIAAQMNYASEEVVRTQRKRCMERLRTNFK